MTTGNCKLEKMIKGRRSELISKLDVSVQLLNKLLDARVLTQEQFRTLMVDRTSDQTMSNLLDYLSKRPDRDYERICRALVETEQQQVVDILEANHDDERVTTEAGVGQSQELVDNDVPRTKELSQSNKRQDNKNYTCIINTYPLLHQILSIDYMPLMNANVLSGEFEAIRSQLESIRGEQESARDMNTEQSAALNQKMQEISEKLRNMEIQLETLRVHQPEQGLDETGAAVHERHPDHSFPGPIEVERSLNQKMQEILEKLRNMEIQLETLRVHQPEQGLEETGAAIHQRHQRHPDHSFPAGKSTRNCEVIRTTKKGDAVLAVTSYRQSPEVYLLRQRSRNQVEIYDSENTKLLATLTVTGLSVCDWSDMTCCLRDSTVPIFISDYSNKCVRSLRMEAEGVRMWSEDQSWDVDDRPSGLSIPPLDDQVLVTCPLSRTLKKYTFDGTQQLQFTLPPELVMPWHATQLPTSEFVVCHGRWINSMPSALSTKNVT